MAKVKFDTKKIEDLIKKQLADQKKRLDADKMRSLSNGIVAKMKESISVGLSPIEGVGRFAGYKQSYQDAIQKRYAGVYSKKARPVNLTLSGDFLNSLKTLSVGIASFKIGFNSELSKKKELGHREGANGQAKRPIIPTSSEQFIVSIQRFIIDSVRKILSD